MVAELAIELENQHLRRLLGYQKQVEVHFLKAIERIFAAAYGLQLVKGEFNLDNYPVLKQAMERELSALVQTLNTVVVNGMAIEWKAAGETFEKLLQDRVGKNLPEKVLRTIRDTRKGALEAFARRKSGKKGLDLSQRVFQYVGQFRSELESGLMVGISEGKPTAVMAREMKQYLRNPDALYRRVRDSKGKLRLSKAAKDFHPGQGVYRSSFKNALRMTSQETNTAYRKSDQVRWAESKFVLGYEVKLSNAHPRFDICDSLKGEYGKDFVWTGWHVQCICYAVPILPSPEEFREYEKAILAGTDDRFKFRKEVKGVPDGFVKWISENTDLMENWAKKPYWVRDNKKYTVKLK